MSSNAHRNEQMPPSQPQESAARLRKACEELKDAVDDGKLGDIVAKHEALILEYYNDVKDQAKQSFRAASSVARVGFWVLISTLAYALLFDALSRFQIITPGSVDASMTVAKLGVISGAFIEFIAAVNFWLYARGAKQFAAFHICLERTHRYLLAYKIAEGLGGNRDETLRDLVCIMANAPMIKSADQNSGPSPRGVMSGTQLKAVSAEVTQS